MDSLRRAYRSQSFVFAFANVRWPKRCTLQVSFLRLLDLFWPASGLPRCKLKPGAGRTVCWQAEASQARSFRLRDRRQYRPPSLDEPARFDENRRSSATAWMKWTVLVAIGPANT